MPGLCRFCSVLVCLRQLPDPVKKWRGRCPTWSPKSPRQQGYQTITQGESTCPTEAPKSILISITDLLVSGGMSGSGVRSLESGQTGRGSCATRELTSDRKNFRSHRISRSHTEVRAIECTSSQRSQITILGGGGICTGVGDFGRYQR